MDKLPLALERKLIRLGTRLIDQKRGRRLVEPTEDRDGFWFGGGNSVRDPNDGSLWLIGRYRDAGDSRTGLTAGPRGRALAIFRSTDNGRSFAEVRTWDKSDLYCGSAVLSIEGSALRLNKRRVQVLVSTEKVRLYPRPVAAFQKPGTGVWSIDAFTATCIDRLDPQESIAPLLTSDDPAYLHLKDPNRTLGLRALRVAPCSRLIRARARATTSFFAARLGMWLPCASPAACPCPRWARSLVCPRSRSISTTGPSPCTRSKRMQRESSGRAVTPARNWAAWRTASIANSRAFTASATSSRSSSRRKARAARATRPC